MRSAPQLRPQQDLKLRSTQTRNERFSYLGNAPFCVSIVCYGVNRFLILGLWQRPEAFWRGHFNDLFLVPCALPPLLLLLRLTGLRSHDNPPRAGEVFFHLILWSLMFEIVGPRLGKGTSDWRDVASYALSGFLAWLWWNKPHQAAT